MPFGPKDPRLTETALVQVVVPTSQTTLYTCPATNRSRLETINIAVGDDGDDDDDDSTKVDLWIVPDGQTVQKKYLIWWDVQFKGRNAFLEIFPFLLRPGEYIVAKASRSNRIVLRIDGTEVGL